MTVEKETKEITKSNERWCKIKNRDVEIVISSPYKSDNLADLVKHANELAKEHSISKSSPGYCA